MKISNAQLFDSSIAQMNLKQSNVAEMQAKLASGKQLVKPSDDAHQAALIQRLNSAMQRQDVFERSLDAADSRLATEETALMGAENLLQRIRELAIQGSNDTLNDADRNIIAKEVGTFAIRYLAYPIPKIPAAITYFLAPQLTTLPLYLALMAL